MFWSIPTGEMEHGVGVASAPPQHCNVIHDTSDTGGPGQSIYEVGGFVVFAGVMDKLDRQPGNRTGEIMDCTQSFGVLLIPILPFSWFPDPTERIDEHNLVTVTLHNLSQKFDTSGIETRPLRHQIQMLWPRFTGGVYLLETVLEPSFVVLETHAENLGLDHTAVWITERNTAGGDGYGRLKGPP